MVSKVKDIIDEEFLKVKKKYLKLEAPIAENGSFVIVGQIDVIDVDGNYRSTYNVKVVVPNDYPKYAPKLFEVGNKIERGEDWHVNNEHGECCVAPRAIEIKLFTNGGKLIDWLDQFAHSCILGFN